MNVYHYETAGGKDLIMEYIVDGQDVHMLHACRKQKNKTEKQDSAIVIKRAKELGKQLSKKFI